MADPANTPLGKMLLEEITPVVMVLRTPLVEEACQKNGLSLVQMLRPFCVFNNFDVPVRTVNDQSYRLQEFRLRLFYDSDIRPPNLENGFKWKTSLSEWYRWLECLEILAHCNKVAKQRLKQVVTRAGEKDLSELCSEMPEINDASSKSETEALPSWFQFFNKELVHTVSFSDHEAFDHPVACLLVVSSNEDQPVNRFVELYNSTKLPSLMNSGAMDPQILRHYLLVHDNQDGSSEKAHKFFSEMRSSFGSDCQLLCINSSQDGVVEYQDNPWVLYSSDGLPSQPLRCFLNVDDFNEIKDLMQDFSSKHIIPHMEQKIRALNQQVSETRKGFRNQIKNLWWRKGKADVVDSPSGPTYTFGSIESQIRVLGDYAFMLHDYELALSNYRLISTDYKLDKAWKRYAGAQEMIGLAYFMLDQSRKEAESCMDTAFTYYLKYALSSQQNATRCGLWWVEMLKARYQYREAATVYFRVGAEEPLHSAVMLEQASYCYLLSKPPMLHKYGFHLVLSGDRYKKCDQIKHAIRTYRSAMSVYKGTTWSHIKDHIHFHIGQWYAILGLHDLAVSHMLEVLACSHQSKTMQESFLKDFLDIIQKMGKLFEVSKLQLPVINISSLRVFSEDHRTYASSAAASVKEKIWLSLEEDLVPSTSIARTNWLELQSKLIPKKYKESSVCVAGEAVKVDIEFKNPLQIPLLLSSVSLICELSASSDDIKSDSNTSILGIQSDGGSAILNHRDVNSEGSLFSLSDVDFSLAGGETTLVQLTVTPRVEGVLQIVGVKWKLSGLVVGFHNFDTSPMKISVKRRQKAKHPHTVNLQFAVVKSLPKLQGAIHSLPTEAYTGDLRHLVLELKNQSKFPVKNIKMKISQSRFLHVGKRESLSTEFPACLEKKTSEHSDIQSDSDMSQAVFLFPEDTIIQGETPFLWPLWFRAAQPGNISFYITIYYEMGDISSIIRYRTLRMHYSLQVLPSLDVSFQISPCPSRLKEFLVRMDVVNKTSSESFQVHQLLSVGQNWEISLLQPVDAIFPSQSIMGHQALSCFFMLKNRSKASVSKDEISSRSPLLGSDVRLGSEGSSEPLFEIASSPLADFHHCERMHQENSHQGALNTVDFILICRPLKNDPVVPDAPNLFSHHACHCSSESTSPISWQVNGPRILYHNFSVPFCEVNFSMIIYNSSDVIASVRIETFDSSSNSDRVSDATLAQQSTSSTNQDGWHDLPLVNDIRVTSGALRVRTAKSLSVESVSPFIWSGSSSTKVQLEPMSRTEIPLQVCVFSPGTFDLSSYVLDWNFLASNGENSGTCLGYPYYLTVLQSA